MRKTTRLLAAFLLLGSFAVSVPACWWHERHEEREERREERHEARHEEPHETIIVK